MLIPFIFFAPLFLGLSYLFIRRIKVLSLLHIFGYAAFFCQSAYLLYTLSRFGKPAAFEGAFFFMDSLSAFFLFTIAVVSFAASLYSAGFVAGDIEKGKLDLPKARLYYLLFDLFILAMIFTVTVNNAGFMWIAIEMTTLISAFLVGFYRTKESVEAAWKYIIICSVGIIIALLGTILYYYALSLAGYHNSLNWTQMFSCAGRLDKNILKIAFIFILVGYGTKAGLAPMHTWLPDAHSQALSPISALLSGVLLKTSIYAIIRFGLILNLSLGSRSYFSHLLLFFGFISLAVSCFLVFVQKDLKRLLAYSSIEHIGVICVGLGIGGTLGIMGALLHIFNHAVTKSLMFFGAGRIVTHYGTHNIKAIRGVISSMPFSGTVFLFGMFALLGFPPFSIFMSELLIIIAGFTQAHYAASGFLLLFLAFIFGAVLSRLTKMLFGHKPKYLQAARERLSVKAAFLWLAIFVIILGIGLPPVLKEAIAAAMEALKGL